MSKNVIIIILSIVVISLLGTVMVTNYNWFSDEWNIGLIMVVGSITGGGLFFYIKIRRN